MQPIKFSCADHQGADLARVQQWDGKQWKIISDFYTADDAILEPMVKDAAAKYAAGEEDHAARLLEGRAEARRSTSKRRRQSCRLPAYPESLSACR